MVLNIEHDAEFLDGRTPHPYTKKIHLPVQRLVRMSYADYWPSSDDFQTCPFIQMRGLVNSVMKAAGCYRIGPEDEWMELHLSAARDVLTRKLQFSLAYGSEIRDAETARQLSEELLPESASARHFVPEGDPLTDHTFDFGLLRILEDKILLFVTWDED